MSKARLVITAVVAEKRPVSEVARSCRVARSWVYALLARYQAEGEAAFEARSRRPRTSPAAIADATVELIIALRKELTERGRPHTIAWHLAARSPDPGLAATISRYLTRPGAGETAEVLLSPVRRGTAEPCWQSDPLAPGRRP